MSRRLACVVAAVVALAAGCGQGGSPAEKALTATEENLDEVRSGVLGMKLVASAAPGPDGQGVGFELSGPFAVAEKKGRLPVADLQYTRLAGAERETNRFVSTGEAAFVVVDGQPYTLDGAHVDGMRARKDGNGGGGLEGLRLSKWIAEPRLAAGPASADGQPTEVIAGDVDPVAALNDLLSVALELGVSEDEAPRRLEGDGAARVRRAVRSSTAELTTGRDDRLLRHLRLVIDFDVRTAEAELRQALGRLAGARLAVEISVEKPNSPVKVDAPGGARPISQLAGTGR